MSFGYQANAAGDPLSNQEPVTEVYAVHGTDPEVQAYGMAKYSRSALSLRESLAEINEQKAEKFLNTFYFQYGHRSIADLAHVAFAIERLSILAATVAVDEPRWDGQERSTRYQDFQKSGYYVPNFGDDAAARALYRETVDLLFAEYRHFSEEMFCYLLDRTPKPVEMKQDAYERTLRARAFDISRYLLPLAANTSLGQIVSARTLENQVSRLLSHTHAEVRRLGELLKRAAQEPAYNVGDAKGHELLEQIERESPAAAERAREFLLRPVKVAPTLMKYAESNAYEIETRRDLTAAAAELLAAIAIEPAPTVDLLDDDPLEVELATTLLYQYSHYSYRQIREAVTDLPEARRREIVEIGLRHRGRYDEVTRAFCAGQQFRFDILMDIGGFRDMHRHRRCVQLLQGYTDLHGYDVPECPGQPTLEEAGLLGEYTEAMDAALAAYRSLSVIPSPSTTLRTGSVEGPAVKNPDAAYLLPLGTRCRALFKMDFAEALYISELRSGVAGHFSYRRVAWEMYQAVARRHPSLAGYFRVSDIEQPVDLLKR